MSVYVDSTRAPFRGMIMCHMIADETQELLDMAASIGLAHKWIQKKGTPKEHFDVSLGYRAKAIAVGAIEIDRRKLAELIKGKIAVEK